MGNSPTVAFDPNASYAPAPAQQAQPAQSAQQASGPAFDPSAPYSPATDAQGSGQPGFLDSALTEAKKIVVGAVKSTVPDPANAKEDIVYGIGGPAALVTYRKIAHLSDTLNSAIGGKVQNYQDLKKDVAQTLVDIHQGKFGQGAASATSTVADVGGLTGLLPDQAAERVRATSEATKPGGNLAGELGTDTTDAGAAVGLAAAGELAPELGGEADTEAVDTTPEAASTEQPSIIDKGKALYQQVTKGQSMEQAPAREALRAGAQASAEDAGVADKISPITAEQPVRTSLDDTIATIGKTERATYDTLNEAAGVDLKSLYDRADELQDALDDPANVANKEKLEENLKTTTDAITKGETQARANNVSPDILDDAKAMTQQRYATQAVKQKIFNNESVVSGNAAHGVPEELNVKAAIRNAENLDKPSRYAPEGSPTRLQQALGKDGAAQFKQSLYDAQRAGQTALNHQATIALLAKVGKWAGYLGGAGLIGADILKKIAE